MDPTDSMYRFLSGLGARRRHEEFILDGFDGEFYLIFDTDYDPETPESLGTCDIYIADVGSPPMDSARRTRVVANCRRHQVMRFLFALGVERFSEATRKFLYESNSVIRAT